MTERRTPNRSRRGALTVLLLLAALAGGAFWHFRPLQAAEKPAPAQPAARPAMPVEVAEVAVAVAEEELAAVGTLRANEAVTVSAEVAGRIEKIAFAEGAATAAGKLLVALDAAIQSAELDRAEANRALSEANYRRAEALLAERAVSQRERDEAHARWQLDQASMRLARAQLEKTAIRAPFAGTLGLRRVSVGDYVQPGQPLVALADTAVLKVEFRLPEKFAAQVKVGQQLRLTSDAYPGRDFAAELYAVDPQVEEESRALVARARLDNRDGALRPGQFVQVRLSVAIREGALFIPEQALIAQPQGKIVFKVVDGTAQAAPVETGARHKGWVEIVSGLAAGDTVVTGGHQKIGPGSPVHPLPADPALFASID